MTPRSSGRFTGIACLTLRYEDLVADVPGAMAQILDHAGVAAPRGLYHASDAHKEQNLWRTGLTPEQGRRRPQPPAVSLARRFGYDIADDLAQPDAAE